MKYFYDTEFIEDGKTIELISIGIVCEDGRKLYYEVSDADHSKADSWVKKNVLKQLWHVQPNKAEYNKWEKHELHTGGLATKQEIANRIIRFCKPEDYGKPEFWAYYADYDHVVLCQLFGRMIDLPIGWPMYTKDIKQLCDSLGNPGLPEQTKSVHNALADAEWCKEAYDFLATYSTPNFYTSLY